MRFLVRTLNSHNKTTPIITVDNQKSQDSWYVNINTLEDLLEFCKSHGRIFIDTDARICTADIKGKTFDLHLIHGRYVVCEHNTTNIVARMTAEFLELIAKD
jgi:hypothetical protein